jgi:hypothetical protein
MAKKKEVMKDAEKKVSKKVDVEEFSIDCAHDAMVDVEKLIPHPRNPNKHPENQIMLLGKIIKAQGFRRPIIVSKRSGFIVVGHARYQAAKYIGMQSVPVDYQDYINEAMEYADMIADNRIAELTERDTDMLKELLLELKDAGDLSDIELTGFTDDELGRLIEDFSFPPLDETDDAPHDDDILAAKIVIKVKDTSIFDEFRNELDKFISEHWTTKQITIVDR